MRLLTDLASDSVRWLSSRLADVADHLGEHGLGPGRRFRAVDFDSRHDRGIAAWRAKGAQDVTALLTSPWDPRSRRRAIEVHSKIPRANDVTVRLPDPGPPYDMAARLECILRDAALALRHADLDPARAVAGQARLASAAVAIAVEAAEVDGCALAGFRLASRTQTMPACSVGGRQRRVRLSDAGRALADVANCPLLFLRHESGAYHLEPLVAEVDLTALGPIELMRAHAARRDQTGPALVEHDRLALDASALSA